MRFLAGSLPEAEAAVRRMSALAAGLSGAEEGAARAMCDLRLGTVLAGARRPSLIGPQNLG